MRHASGPVTNRLLEALTDGERKLLTGKLRAYTLARGDMLFEPGQNVTHVYFPGPATIAALVLDLREGVTAEAAMIGQEGAIGGIISEGDKPAFTRGVVQVAGTALRLPVEALDDARRRSPHLRDHFARYADCFLAQVLQSVVCNAVHDFDARLARWILATQDRMGRRELNLTQEFIAEMLGVRRTYATRVIGRIERSGAIARSRGRITVMDRRKLERQACECYRHLRRHYERILPGV